MNCRIPPFGSPFPLALTLSPGGEKGTIRFPFTSVQIVMQGRICLARFWFFDWMVWKALDGFWGLIRL